MSSGFRHGPSRSMMLMMVTSPILSCFMVALPCCPKPYHGLTPGQGEGPASRHVQIDNILSR
jgi:hypothetical protein